MDGVSSKEDWKSIILETMFLIKNENKLNFGKHGIPYLIYDLVELG